MRRDEAIRLLCEAELARLTPQERREQLEIMQCEDWQSDPRWAHLPAELRLEFAERPEITEPCATRYDRVLMIWLEGRYVGATNDHLRARLREAGHETGSITGRPFPLVPCPCCGYCTLGEMAAYEICPVCWWEDDGQDNSDADDVRGGPNAALSLTHARRNFLRAGIFDPSREDLRARQAPSDKYERGRAFELHAGGRVVREPASGWSASLDEKPR